MTPNPHTHNHPSARPEWVWLDLHWPSPLPLEIARNVLYRIASDTSLGHMVFEAVGQKGQVSYRLGVKPDQHEIIARLLADHVPGLRTSTPAVHTRPSLMTSANVSLSRARLALNSSRTLAVTRSVLASLASARQPGELVMIQVYMGGRISARPVPAHVSDPHQSWSQALTGSSKATAEQRALVRERQEQPGCAVAVRIGATAGDSKRADGLISSVVNALRTSETAGVKVRGDGMNPHALMTVRRPWRFPLHLSVKELACVMGWPIAEPGALSLELPGVPSAHPRLMPPPDSCTSPGRVFARATTPGREVPLGISPRDALEHTVFLGPTGAGKSTALLNLITADMQAGRSVFVLDPKADLVHDVLERVPPERRGDVVVIDPTSLAPVGLNPLHDDVTSPDGGIRPGRADALRSPELRADSILAVFKALFADSWGPRTEDILMAGLLTLARTPGTTLTDLPRLLTDMGYRRRLIAPLVQADPEGLGMFWADYDARGAKEQAHHIAPILNKLRQFLLRPGLRGVLGQSAPKFHLSELFTGRKIVLLSLNKGITGQDTARLLGSLVISTLWLLTLGRANTPAERRHPVGVYIDEVQDYLHLPLGLDDALAQARGLGVAFTLAHQYRAQLPAHIRAGVDTNARNKVVFGLSAGDASDMAKLAPGLEPQDLMLLPRFGVYVNLMHQGHATGWVSGVTLPAPAPVSDAIGLREASTLAYGQPVQSAHTEQSMSAEPVPATSGEPGHENEPAGDTHPTAHGQDHGGPMTPGERVYLRPRKRAKHERG